jgi:prenyltransferase beta subunit
MDNERAYFKAEYPTLNLKQDSDGKFVEATEQLFQFWVAGVKHTTKTASIYWSSTYGWCVESDRKTYTDDEVVITQDEFPSREAAEAWTREQGFRPVEMD